MHIFLHPLYFMCNCTE